MITSASVSPTRPRPRPATPRGPVQEEEMVLVGVGQKDRRETLFLPKPLDFADVRTAVDENASSVPQVERVGMRVPAVVFAFVQQDPFGETADHVRLPAFPAGEAGIGVSWIDFISRAGGGRGEKIRLLP